MVSLAVVLVEPLYEENVGYTARVMKNFGVEELILVNPRCELGIEAVKRAMHGRDVLERARLASSLDEIVKTYDLVIGTTGKQGKKLTQTRRFMTPERLAEKVSKLGGKVAIVFGREDRGLTNEELRFCDGVVTIPANPEYPILNLSHAVAVVLYVIFRELRPEVKLPKPSMPSREEMMVLLEYVKRLSLLLWSSETRAERAVLIVKRFLSSCLTTREDVRVLLGLIRESYDRLSRPGTEPHLKAERAQS